MEKTRKENKKTKARTRNREFLVVMYLFLALFLSMMAYFVYFQAVKSETFINSPYNSLQDLFSRRVVRGDILSADGETLASTRIQKDGTEIREYPYNRVFAHVVGYAENGKAGLENQENFSLLRSHEFFLKQMGNDIAGNKSKGDNIITTLDTQIQQTAYDALGSFDGAVIVMEPKTGKIIAMVSKPDYDPNSIKQEWESVSSEESTALFNRATQGKYAPGSVFKIFTTIGYYRENPKKYKKYSYDCSSFLTMAGQTIHCAGNTRHGNEDLEASFANSCNASFANIALTLDRESFQQTCESMLFNQNLPIRLESSQSSFSLSDTDSDGMAMETGIGQGKTLVSPLHMLLVASAIDNGGVVMTPYLVDRTENASGDAISANEPREYKTILSEKEAKLLKRYMRFAVTNGTAGRLLGQSYEAYGKTGTAQFSDTSEQTNAWFCGFAKKEGYKDLAVAVIVEKGGAGSSVAVPVAKKIFDVYFNR